MNPLLVAAVPGILSGISSFFSGRSNRRAQTAQTATEIAARERQAALELAQRQREQGLAARGMNPLFQQQARQRNALIASLLGHSTNYNMDDPNSGSQWDPKDFSSFFTPEARATAERDFTNSASAASGGNYANSGDVGYGSAGGGMGGALTPQITPVGPAMGNGADLEALRLKMRARQDAAAANARARAALTPGTMPTMPGGTNNNGLQRLMAGLA